MQEIKKITDIPVTGKRVLLHVDFDVPLTDDYRVADDTRIKAALPSITYLREQGARVILISKLGRPGGKVVEELRLAPVGARLGELLGVSVACATDVVGVSAIATVEALAPGSVVLLENLRFETGEEANDDAFTKALAALGDVFVNDAFADSHRAHASIVGLPKYLPHAAGVRLMEEVEHLQIALAPTQPALAIIGGAKFETKQPLVEKLVALYGTLLLGGALANDLLLVRGTPIGASLTSRVPVPESIAANDNIHIPIDLVVDGPNGRETGTGDVRADEHIVDIGSRTAVAWGKRIHDVSFVVWNGPMGVYEKGYMTGTDALAHALAESNCHAVIGGGDTAAALAKYSFDPSRIFISTGGGAMLQFLAEGTLPALEALKLPQP